ncbi:putative DNA helicase [Papiliotrema laurentii]|uniref:DNA helicase n=1 Tax=Papiliotrema laurentii TaxID=5418 RepID=A0AAD9D0M8_PAPLA|nr:putative DNA helicase [Papiliotrema laurentii]
MPLLEPVQPTREELEAFLDRHEALLQLERGEEEEQTRLLNSNCSARELERKGLSLGGLGVSAINVGLGGKTLIELCRPTAYHADPIFPPHTFRTGDPARIEAHVSDSTKARKRKDEGEGASGAVEGIVYKVGKDKVVIAVDEKKEVDLPERVRLLKLANSVTFDRMEKTLQRLRRLVVPNELGSNGSSEDVSIGLVNALLGVSQPTWSDSIPAPLSSPQAQTIEWFGDKLNDSQKQAIEFCLKANHVACIHGPPGTGKTHTLVELVFQLLARPAGPHTATPPRILITTPSNLALDNILLRLHFLAQQEPYARLLPPGSILRLGHPTRVHRELISQTLDYRASNGDDGALVRDVAREIEGHLSDLGKKKGERGAVKGKERGAKWAEVRELRKEYRQREAKVVKNVVAAARVVLATCHSAGSRQINNMTFDYCIIDEATQAVEAVCWVPILKSNKVILAGDPQQLPPTILSRGEPAVQGKPSDKSALDSTRPRLQPPKTLETTLFDRLERLYGTGVKRVLTTQYRMNEQIAEFPNHKLYRGELISDPAVAKRTLLDLPGITAETEEANDVLDPVVVFFDTAGCEFYERNEGETGDGGRAIKALGEGSKSNANEAAIVVKWAEQLVSCGVPPDQIAVVTPYQAQVSLIAETLGSMYPEMTIGSVDGLQGQEREAIILSLVRSNDKAEVGFLGEYRRLNVAMTRARRQLCVVGDSETVGKGSKYLESWIKWLEDHADVRYAGDVVG